MSEQFVPRAPLRKLFDFTGDTRNIFLWLVWAVCLGALFISQSFFGVYGQIVAMALLLISLPWTLRGGRSDLREAKVPMIFLAIFVVIAGLDVVHASEPDALLKILLYLGFLAAPMAFLLARKFTSSAWLERILALAALGAYVTFGHAMYEMIVLGLPRAWTPINPIKFAQISLLLATLSFAALFLKGKSLPNIFFAVAAALACANVLLSGTRGVFLALLPILLLTSLWLFLVLGRRARMALIVLMIVAPIGGALAINQFSPQSAERFVSILGIAKDSVTTGETQEVSSSFRLYLYGGAWQTFTENPIVGVGSRQAFKNGVAHIDLEAFPPSLVPPERLERFRHLHSDFLHYLAAWGIIGLVMFLALLALPLAFWHGDEKSKLSGRFLAIALPVQIFIVGSTDSFLMYDQTVATYAILLCFFVGIRAYRAPEVQT